MRKGYPCLALTTILSLLLQLLPAPAFSKTLSDRALTLPQRSLWEEEPERRTVNSRHYRAGDYMVAEISAAPIQYQDTSGTWKAVGATLEREVGGGFTGRGGHFSAFFSDQAQGNHITVQVGDGRSIRMGLDEQLPDLAEPHGPGQLGRMSAQAEGRKLRYREAEGRLSYEYEVDDLAVKENIILHRFAGKSSFELPLQLEGLEVRDDGAGGYQLFDAETGSLRATIPPLVVTDGAGQGPPGASQAILPDGEGYRLWIAVDHEWLASPERRYPVVIDPSVVIAPVGADLMMTSIATAGAQGGSVYKSGSLERRTLLKFNLTSIPAGARISTAHLDVARPLATGIPAIEVREIGTEWYQGVATWTSPRGNGSTWTAGGDLGSTVLGNLTAGPVALNDLVQAWVNGTRRNDGVALLYAQNGDPLMLSNPTLQVVYALDVDEPTVAVSGMSSGAVVRSSLPIAITATDGAGGIRRVDLLVDDLPIASEEDPSGAAVTLQLDPRKVSPGDHTLTVAAYDYAGNRGVRIHTGQYGGTGQADSVRSKFCCADPSHGVWNEV